MDADNRHRLSDRNFFPTLDRERGANTVQFTAGLAERLNTAIAGWEGPGDWDVAGKKIAGFHKYNHLSVSSSSRRPCPSVICAALHCCAALHNPNDYSDAKQLESTRLISNEMLPHAFRHIDGLEEAKAEAAGFARDMGCARARES
eukprot:4532767-Pleurochrysis_carterae.AAC.2